jgi:hypothetical protein
MMFGRVQRGSYFALAFLIGEVSAQSRHASWELLRLTLERIQHGTINLQQTKQCDRTIGINEDA